MNTQMMKKSPLRNCIHGAALLLGFLFQSSHARAQCFPTIYVDGAEMVVGTSEIYGINLPYWLKEGQTLAVGYGVDQISVIEFTPVNNDLEFSQVRAVNNALSTPAQVPPGKVWKIESVAKNIDYLISSTNYTYSTPGTFSFQPPCTGFFRIQVWGGGGGGGGRFGSSASAYNGGGGGGGGYAEGLYYLNKNLTYTVTVGAGGAGSVGSSSYPPGTAGGSSSFALGSSIMISASGGQGGGGAINCCFNGNGGVGGSGFGQLNFTGQNGSTGSGFLPEASRGGNAGQTSGTGGLGGCPGSPGIAPGGGGAGAYGSGTCNGGNGAPGRVVISSVVK